MAQDKYFLTKAMRDKITYTEMKTLYDQEIKQLKNKKFESFIRNSDNPSKVVWSVINAERTCGNRSGHPEINLENNGRVVSNCREKAQIFNNFFLSVRET